MNSSLRILNIKGNLKVNRGVLKLKLPQQNLLYGDWQMCATFLSYVCKEDVDSLTFVSTNFIKDSKINDYSEIEVYNPTIFHFILKGNLNFHTSMQMNENWLNLNNISQEITFHFYDAVTKDYITKNCDVFLILSLKPKMHI